MLRRPVTISIAPSRWSRRASLALASAVLLGVAHYGPLWLLAAAVLLFWGVMWRERRRERRWQLRWMPGIDGGWQLRDAPDDAWRHVALRCDYLGAWMIGLNVAGQRRWLWPDSASFAERQALRRVLLWSTR